MDLIITPTPINSRKKEPSIKYEMGSFCIKRDGKIISILLTFYTIYNIPLYDWNYYILDTIKIS